MIGDLSERSVKDLKKVLMDLETVIGEEIKEAKDKLRRANALITKSTPKKTEYYKGKIDSLSKILKIVEGIRKNLERRF